MLALVLSGILVTTQNGSELSRDSWRDDGNVITSQLNTKGNKATVTIDRKARIVHFAIEGSPPIDRSLPPGAAALVNLDWAAYAILAEEFKDASTPKAFKALIDPARAIDATVMVKPGAGGAREVTVAVGPLEVHATVDKSGAVIHAAVPLQGIEVMPAKNASAALVRRAPPAGVVEEPLEVENRGAKLAGVLWLPATRPAKVPVVIIIAGSGPVDRDGNAGGLLRSDTYRLLAEALAKRGIASIRFDKRGVGASTLGGRPEDFTFDEFVSDAAAFVTLARVNEKLSGVYLFGHSEGSLIALEIAASRKVDGVISAAGAGRQVAEVMRDQIAPQLTPADVKEYDALVADLRAGKTPEPKSAALQRLMPPTVAKFMRGMLLTDPRPLAAAYKGKLTVLQGDNDVQVTVDKDARALAAAHPGAKLVVLKDVGHMLKHDPHKGLDQPSYRDPTMPIDPAVVDATVATVR